MPFPVPTRMPSEHCIESMTNHHILNTLSNPNAWIFCPTTNEEAQRGYDSSLQSYKFLTIQYKAIKHVYRSSEVKIEINYQQLLNYHRYSSSRSFNDSAYYAFCEIPSYADMSILFAKSPASFIDKCVFIRVDDVHATLSGDGYIKGSIATGRFEIFNKRAKSGTLVPYIDGRSICSDIKKCVRGTPIDTISEDANPQLDNLFRPRFNTLFYPRVK